MHFTKLDDIMREENYVDILKQHLKLKLGHKWVFQMDNYPKHTSKVVAKWQQSQGIGVAITKPWPQSYRKFVVRTEKACVSKEADKPDSVAPALSGGMGLVEGYPKSLTQVKQFKGNATKY